MWVQIIAGAVAVVAVLAGVVGVVVSIRETDAERGLTYPPGSTERRTLIPNYRCGTTFYQGECGRIESGFDSETGQNQSRTLTQHSRY